MQTISENLAREMRGILIGNLDKPRTSRELGMWLSGAVTGSCIGTIIFLVLIAVMDWK